MISRPMCRQSTFGTAVKRRMRRPVAAMMVGMMVLLAPIMVAGPLIRIDFGGAAEAQSYRIRSGDQLRVEVVEDETLNRTVLVLPDGQISFPLVGSIQASGRTVEQVEAALRTRLGPNFAATPNLFVSIASLAEVKEAPPMPATPAEPITDDIYVLGEVNKPGLIAVEPGASVLQLFAQMGGFTRFAATERIQLRRVDAAGVERIYLLDYDAILAGTSPNGRAVLVGGDVIVVPERRLFE